MSRRSRKRAKRRKEVVLPQVHEHDPFPGSWYIQPYDVAMPAPNMQEPQRIHVTVGGKGVVARAVKRAKAS